MILLKKYKAIVYLPNLYAILQFLLLNENKWEDILFLTHPGIDKKVSERISDSYCLYTGRIDKYITLIKLFILSVWIVEHLFIWEQIFFIQIHFLDSFIRILSI